MAIPSPTHAPSRRADLARRLLVPASAALLVLAALQVMLAGGAVFGASSWSVHVMGGMLVVAVALILVVMAAIARPGRAYLGAAVVAFVVSIVQPMSTVLAERIAPAFGLVHGLGAALLVILASLMLVRQDRVAGEVGSA